MTKTVAAPLALETDVLVIGAGGAGMYAALAAAENANVVLLDKNMIGRGGATVMAQMTVAAALAGATPATNPAWLAAAGVRAPGMGAPATDGSAEPRLGTAEPCRSQPAGQPSSPPRTTGWGARWGLVGR